MYNFTFVCCDTDSCTFCKPDQTPFSEEEQERLLNEINDLFPEKIAWEPEGPYDKIIIFKAKNYVLYEKGKIKLKGSALKSSKLEPALKDLQQEIIEAIIYERNNFLEIYHKYIKEAMNIKDIRRWCGKKTVTDKIETSERANETKVKDALVGSNYREGDKIYTFYLPDGSLCLAENFTGVYDKLKMCERVYKSIQVFDSVIDIDSMINYKLKKNQKALDELVKMM
jgi:DNA polymerase elongation subunit (family B)